MSVKFSEFAVVPLLEAGDIVVGLKDGLDVQYTVPSIGDNNLTYVTNTDERDVAPNSDPLSIKPTGFLASVTTTGVLSTRVLTGVTDKITITNPTGLANPIFDIAATYAGQASITTVGVLTTGTWEGDLVEVPFGGTGAASFTPFTVILAGATSTSPLTNVVSVGQAGYTLTSNGAGAAPTFQIPASEGTTIAVIVEQTAHGFTVGQIVYFNGTEYALASADTSSEAEVIGIVDSIIGANTFKLAVAGLVDTLAGLTPSGVYFLSDLTPGALTLLEPGTPGLISKPLLIAVSATSGFFYNMRGKIIPAAPVANAEWVDQSTTPETMVKGNIYVTNTGAAQTVFNLPATAAFGDTFSIRGSSTGGWKLNANSGQTINTLTGSTTVAGSITSDSRYDGVTVACTAANTTFLAYGVQSAGLILA